MITTIGDRCGGRPVRGMSIEFEKAIFCARSRLPTALWLPQ